MIIFNPSQPAKITIDDGNGNVTTIEATPDGKLTRPADPVRDGYEFLGWYNGDKLWDFDNDVATSDTTLTAKWKKIESQAGSQTATKTANKKENKTAAAATGDRQTPVVWLWVLTFSGGLVIVTAAGRKRKKEEEYNE